MCEGDLDTLSQTEGNFNIGVYLGYSPTGFILSHSLLSHLLYYMYYKGSYIFSIHIGISWR